MTIISQEDFQKMAPPAPRKQNPEVPPPPPPVQHVCIFYEFEKLNIVLYYILITRWKINKRLVRNESDNHSTVAHGSTLSLRTSRQTREHQENEKPGILIIHQWSITSVGSWTLRNTAHVPHPLGKLTFLYYLFVLLKQHLEILLFQLVG